MFLLMKRNFSFFLMPKLSLYHLPFLNLNLEKIVTKGTSLIFFQYRLD